MNTIKLGRKRNKMENNNSKYEPNFDFLILPSGMVVILAVLGAVSLYYKRWLIAVMFYCCTLAVSAICICFVKLERGLKQNSTGDKT